MFSQRERLAVMLAAPAVIGAFFRTYRLGEQVLFQDEIHALMAAAEDDTLASVLTTFGMADRCIPVTLLYRTLLATTGIDEFILRSPMWLAGLLSLVLFPLLSRHWVNDRTALTFAWLLALSPQLIFHSRMARPYMIALACAFPAVLLFRRWLEGQERRDAIIYAVLACLTGWFLPVFLPFVLGPFVLSGLDALRAGRWREIYRIGVLGLCTLGSLALFLGPPLATSFQDLSSKAAGVSVGRILPAIEPALRAYTGSPGYFLAAGMTVLIVVALVSAWSGFRSYLALLIVIQVASVIVVAPIGTARPMILARYLLPAVPCLLLLAAVGYDRLVRVRSALATTALVVAVLLLGPLIEVTRLPAAWSTYFLQDLTFRADDPLQEELGPISEFYRALARNAPGRVTLVEVPGNIFADKDPVPRYQRVHRQKVLAGNIRDLCHAGFWTGLLPPHPGVALRTAVMLSDLDSIGERQVSFVVFHLDLFAEVGQDSGSGWLRACIDTYFEAFGPPIFEDEHLVVFDVRADPTESDPTESDLHFARTAPVGKRAFDWAVSQPETASVWIAEEIGVLARDLRQTRVSHRVVAALDLAQCEAVSRSDRWFLIPADREAYRSWLESLPPDRVAGKLGGGGLTRRYVTGVWRVRGAECIGRMGPVPPNHLSMGRALPVRDGVVSFFWDGWIELPWLKEPGCLALSFDARGTSVGEAGPLAVVRVVDGEGRRMPRWRFTAGQQWQSHEVRFDSAEQRPLRVEIAYLEADTSRVPPADRSLYVRDLRWDRCHG